MNETYSLCCLHVAFLTDVTGTVQTSAPHVKATAHTQLLTLGVVEVKVIGLLYFIQGPLTTSQEYCSLM